MIRTSSITAATGVGVGLFTPLEGKNFDIFVCYQRRRQWRGIFDLHRRLPICLFSHHILKTDRRLEETVVYLPNFTCSIQMSHDESCKPFIYGSEG